MSKNKTDQGTQPRSGLGTSKHVTACSWTTKIRLLHTAQPDPNRLLETVHRLSQPQNYAWALSGRVLVGIEQNCVMSRTKNVTVEWHAIPTPYLVPAMNMHHKYSTQLLLENIIFIS